MRQYAAGNAGIYALLDRTWARIERRFWPLVNKQPHGCWLWLGKFGLNGRPTFSIGTGATTAARVAWELTYSRIPPGQVVCHNCPGGDNPLCVNPAHMFVDTQQGNIQDMCRKGRWGGGGPKGERSGRAVITEALVLTVRAEYAAGHTLGELGRKHHVAHNTLKAAILGQSWGHLPGAVAFRRERRARLPREIVQSIRTRFTAGESVTTLARAYDLSLNTAWRIAHGLTYTEIA